MSSSLGGNTLLRIPIEADLVRARNGLILGSLGSQALGGTFTDDVITIGEYEYRPDLPSEVAIVATMAELPPKPVTRMRILDTITHKLGIEPGEAVHGFSNGARSLYEQTADIPLALFKAHGRGYAAVQLEPSLLLVREGDSPSDWVVSPADAQDILTEHSSKLLTAFGEEVKPDVTMLRPTPVQPKNKTLLPTRNLEPRRRTGTWMDDGNCAYYDPAIFFPTDKEGSDIAKRLCQGCPVMARCLEYALENREEFGVWGGTSERERRRIARARAMNATIAG